MNLRVRTACALLLTLPALAAGPGCGEDDPAPRATISLCGVACVGGGSVESEIHLSRSRACEVRFLALEQARPSQVCGYAWERLPASPCVGTAILTPVMAIPCGVKCTRSPDYSACVLGCVAELVGLKGNCVVCAGARWLELQLCLWRPGLSPEDVSACLRTYILESSLCAP